MCRRFPVQDTDGSAGGLRKPGPAAVQCPHTPETTPMTPRSLARAGLLTVAAAAVGCDRLGSPQAPAPVPVVSDAPVAVTVAVPKRKTIAWSVEQPGTVQAFETTPLVAKLAGYVKTITKDLGDPVEAGEVLATLDIPELEREADQKKAAVAEA